MHTYTDTQQWRGAKAVDSNGDKLGTVDEVYLDRGSNEPEWITISTGLFGTRTSFAPVAGADFRDGEVHLAYTKDQVKDAPNVDADGALSIRGGAASVRTLRTLGLRRLGAQRHPLRRRDGLDHRPRHERADHRRRDDALGRGAACRDDRA